ncbi:DUF6377 domain-containing protein [Ferruginibacter sp. SUN002]|uniref:DUF6377 domain-containing protein n=1 Tax=Ferruginibacter sp. SUN002 TaxID=2937789 RepID=UPI003D36A57B
MTKHIVTSFLLLIASFYSFSQSTQPYNLKELDIAIADADKYDQKFLNSIDSLKSRLKLTSTNDLITQYDLSNQIYNYYKVFKYDSAYDYAFKCQKIAYQSNDPEKIAVSSIQLNFTLLSSGLFKEASDSLAHIDISRVNDNIKAEYYTVKARYYYDLADYTQDNYFSPTYTKTGTIFLDSALALYSPKSFSYLYYSGLKEFRLTNLGKAEEYFTKLISNGGLTQHEFALTTSTLSAVIYFQKGSIDSVISLLIDAAIADIKTSTKETSAMYNLAQYLFKKDQIKSASKYIDYAMKDADFYGARQRKVQLITVLPLIEAEKINQVESQKKILIAYSIVMTILLLAVIFLAYTVYKQVAKLKLAQKIISEASQKEHEINEQLNETNLKLQEMHVKEQKINEALTESNNKLSESNKIKEEYIGYFFNANSEFYNRIERFKRTVDQKLRDRKFDEVKHLVNQINVKDEKEEALRNFDKAFLKLFPNFVDQFNLLFNPEDRIILPNREILNTDLRIYALIRLGVKDINKISEILEYSANTIHNYKSRIKIKSIVPNDEFLQRIMNIES